MLYPFVDEFDLRGFDFPIKINDIEAIERRNGITIGVYSYDEQTGIFPVRWLIFKVTKDKRRKYINM